MDEYWKLVEQLKKEYENRIYTQLTKLFKFVWKSRLVNGAGDPTPVVQVRGWRTALVDDYPSAGGRCTVTFLFKIWKWYI
jgi:hypothetical protein